MDLFSAAADPFFLIIDLGTGGAAAAGRKALLVGGKEAAESAARKLAEKGGEKLFITTLRDTGLELARKQIGKDVANKMGEKEILNWAITGTMAEMQQAVKSAIGRATTFEITKPVQFVFKYSGIDRAAFKRITGLEARLFMRGDSKVYIRLANVAGGVVGSRTAAFFERTAQDLTLGTAFESEPGQKIADAGVKTAISAKEELRVWQQNVSAWWLLSASSRAPNSDSHDAVR